MAALVLRRHRLAQMMRTEAGMMILERVNRMAIEIYSGDRREVLAL